MTYPISLHFYLEAEQPSPHSGTEGICAGESSSRGSNTAGNGEVINMIVHFSAFFKNSSPSFVLVITLITKRKCANLCV